ncbi:hypothetical protein R6Z07F_003070 [Ovis aries]
MCSEAAASRGSSDKQRVKVGPATLGAARHLKGLELENVSCRGHLRGAGLEPPWRGQPRENLLRPER